MTNRHTILQRWMDTQERKPAWVARKVGRRREYISLVYHGHKPVTDKLARDLECVLGIPLINLPGQADVQEQRNRRGDG